MSEWLLSNLEGISRNILQQKNDTLKPTIEYVCVPLTYEYKGG